MWSMTCATLGWACWWGDLVLARTVPDLVPDVALVSTVGSLFAAVGLVAAVLTLRGRNRVWMGLSLIPLFANGSLLSMPFLVQPGMLGHG
jgi:hypothetical protein